MKVIFLDIDGVLNSVDSMVAFHEWKPKGTRVMIEDKLDEVSVGLLRRLCNETGAKIVVSSTWRMGRTGDDFIEIFTRHDWPEFPYLDQTPIGHQINPIGERTRGHEIQHWLDNNGNPEYVILDDDSDMLESQMNNFVHCSGISGFRGKHYCKAMRILGHPEDLLESQVNWKRHTEKSEYD